MAEVGDGKTGEIGGTETGGVKAKWPEQELELQDADCFIMIRISGDVVTR
jgi:hypothetical protein